jgi:hypothetical protein
VDPFAQDDAPCQVDRDPARELSVKSSKPKPGSVGQLTLRLRGVDATDVFQILTQLTGQGFLVDGDVAGRVSGDLARVTLEEALASLAAAGLAVSPPGSVRRVSLAVNVPRGPSTEAKNKKATKGKGAGAQEPRGGTAPAGGSSAAEAAGQKSARLSLSLKRAEVRDILATMAEVDPSYVAFGPQGSLGRASLWVRDLALPDVWMATTRAAQLVERSEEGRRLLERNPGSQEALVPVAAEPVDAARLRLGPRELSFAEIDLVAVATALGGWHAYAYTPTGTLVSYVAGEKLADGVVKDVQSTDVLVESDEGQERVFLPAR